MEELQKVKVDRVVGKPLRLCTNCGDVMIAAKSSKYVSERAFAILGPATFADLKLKPPPLLLRGGHQLKR